MILDAMGLCCLDERVVGSDMTDAKSFVSEDQRREHHDGDQLESVRK